MSQETWLCKALEGAYHHSVGWMVTEPSFLAYNFIVAYLSLVVPDANSP